MVVLSNQSALNELFLAKTCNPSTVFTAVPEVDLSHPDAKTMMVKACQEIGLFKVVNHGIPPEVITRLENEALKFFMQSQSQKDKAGPPDPFGYGSKRIGTNGDMGWVEYLLLSTNPDIVSPKSVELFEQNPEALRLCVEEYIGAVKKMCCFVLEEMGEGLGLGNVFSRMVREERSDSCFRVNRYPACVELEESGRNLIGFGEHTDPQILSVLRSNNTSGLQICLPDGTWASIPPDPSSFFVNVGDLFQSVKHRVLADSRMSRLSMIYFGGPSLEEKIGPLPSLVSKEEQNIYRELTWREYKNAAYKSRLSDHRITLFHKSSHT
ncbi:gibberellin 2-beta-dioxygenase-like isoform X2 [Vigna unguiculata]|uniref:gibberellin 2-beta-dioxygenase-like isoform X2 n=1 Tax=Vigna unguiculata TaxID=3917 RepID=UPI0010160B77|nr:gibberellin 2-beta-dioxygenase-like isoform X2 [Vigna unguiculata]